MTRYYILAAGLAAFASMIGAPGYARDCGDRVNWVCYEADSSDPQLRAGFQQDKSHATQLTTPVAPPSREKRQARPPSVPAAPAARAGPAEHREPPRSTEAGRAATNSKRSDPHRPGTAKVKNRIGQWDSEQKKALFQDFIVWQNKQIFDAQVNR
jgi:hypothetical protein